MANQEHLDILNQGVDVWNEWREKHYELVPDLGGIDLSWRNLSGAILRQTDLSWTNLSYAQLEKANLSYAGLVRTNLIEANLSEANLSDATGNGAFLEQATLKNAILIRTNLSKADLSGADLSGANLFEANLSGTQLSGAKLERASLARAILDSTTLTGATLTHCLVYGVSAWNVQLAGATQLNLVITPPNEPTITVDKLEVAQFIYLLLNNPRIRDVIDTVAKKAVLILGRFTPERKAVLDTLRQALRTHGYLPILFDFDKPSNRDFTETIMTLAGLCLFIIADITNPSSAPLELQATVPNYMIPFVPLLEEGEQPFAMFQDLKGKYDWVLDLLVYDSPSNLVKGLERAVIKPALEKRDELLAKKVEQLRTRHIGEYL